MRLTKRLLLASILLVAFVSLQLGVLGFTTHGSFGGSTRRSKANYSWKLDATRKISNDNAVTKVLYQKVVRPSANLPDILFLGYLVAGILSCITIILIPFGLQSFKLAGISFWPVGRRVVTKEMAKLVRERAAAKSLDKIQGKNSTDVADVKGDDSNEEK